MRAHMHIPSLTAHMHFENKSLNVCVPMYVLRMYSWCQMFECQVSIHSYSVPTACVRCATGIHLHTCKHYTHSCIMSVHRHALMDTNSADTVPHGLPCPCVSSPHAEFREQAACEVLSAQWPCTSHCSGVFSRIGPGSGPHGPQPPV